MIVVSPVVDIFAKSPAKKGKD